MQVLFSRRKSGAMRSPRRKVRFFWAVFAEIRRLAGGAVRSMRELFSSMTYRFGEKAARGGNISGEARALFL
jgi:hypothetical protein